MFGIGETELVIIVGFAFLLFGPDKLPGMGRTIGRALRQFRQAQEGFTQVVQAEVMDPLNEAMTITPSKRPKQEDLDADADLEGEDTGGARKAETFAERKARLRAEREAAEKAAAEAAAAEAPATATDATEAEGADTDDKDAPEAAEPSAEPAEQEEPAPKTAAALYAMAPRRRATKSEPAPEPDPEAAAEDEPDVTPASEPEPAAQEDGPTGKEDGSED